MKQTLYCVGTPIKVVDYASWFEGAFFSGTAIPTRKRHIYSKDILASFKKHHGLSFFLTPKEARDFAFQQRDFHPDGKHICFAPAVFEVEGSLKQGTKLFLIETIISAYLLDYPTFFLDHSLIKTQQRFPFLNPCQKERSEPFICSEKNFHGNFNKLLNKPAILAFAYANTKGMATNRESKMHLPKEMVKAIAIHLDEGLNPR